MAKPTAWMPMYWGDYAKDTGHLGAVHHGAYLMLIKHYWVTGEALPADDAQLWRIACMDSVAHWRKVKTVVLAFFEKRDARLVHERIEHELAKAEGNVERRAEMARRAANSRWEKERGDAPRIAPRMPSALPGECSPSSSSDNSHGKISTDAARPPAPEGAASRTPPRVTSAGLTSHETWRQRLVAYDPHNIRKTWPAKWGPRPDAPGIQPLIPPDLLRWWRQQRAAA